jgi:hypothetical protein
MSFMLKFSGKWCGELKAKGKQLMAGGVVCLGWYKFETIFLTFASN